jgi:hypothetical protein
MGLAESHVAYQSCPYGRNPTDVFFACLCPTFSSLLVISCSGTARTQARTLPCMLWPNQGSPNRHKAGSVQKVGKPAKLAGR